MREVQRTLALKVEIDWRDETSKALYNRLRDLSWMAAHYRNSMMRRKWAEAMGYVVSGSDDKHSVTKQGRRLDKGELSGDAYSCCEQEVQGAWARDGKRILAGQPLSEWKPAAALSISGKEKRSDSGIWLEHSGGRYLLHLRAQGKDSDGGSWLVLPIAKHAKRDEYQAPILQGMVSWSVPIKKATVQVGRHEITVRLSYKVAASLPPMGERVATLGPVTREGRLLLRTETQTQDYSSKIAEITGKKDSWDKIRRRLMAQVGRRHGHARLKRELLLRRFRMDEGAESSFEVWCHSYLHMWSRDVVDWCYTQGVGTIQVAAIDTGDWPAYKFTSMLKYKADATGIAVTEGAELTASAERTAKAEIAKQQRKIQRRSRAVRELEHQLRETA